MHETEDRESIYKPGDEIGIRIGELILPFSHPANYREAWFSEGETETKFRLNIDFLGRSIPLKILSSLNIREGNGIELVPFDSEKGYVIDRDDLDLERRRKKLLEEVKRHGGFGINKKFPLGLSISINSDCFVEDGLAVYKGEPDKFGQKQEISYDSFALFFFNSLRCRIFLPNSEFEAMLDQPPLEIKTERFREEYGHDDYEFYFEDFYPLETGPLASETDGTFSMEDDGSDLEVGPGHKLYFADRREELEKIAIEFVLITNQLG